MRWSARSALVLTGCLVASLLFVGLTAQTSSRQGVNFQVSSHSLPLYAKAIGFLHRHYEYQRLSRNITTGLRSDQAQALAVFNWTRQHIRPTPSGWPIIDDHILHIIIRGHGVDEQMADVFSTLSTYAGIPSFWKRLEPSQEGNWLVLAFAKIDGGWAVFDVWRDIVFTNARGQFLSASELARNPQLAAPLVGELTIGSVPYVEYFTMPTFEDVPRTLRAELQMPGPRIAYEFGRAVGLLPDANVLVPPRMNRQISMIDDP